jgi:CubicO group peptidase (beta-lactamase class C family)
VKLLLTLILITGISSINAQSFQYNAKIDSLISAYFPKTNPGGAICVIKDGKTLYKKAFGMANLDYRIPVSDSTLFNLASVSKQFTAFLTLLLEEEGKLSLDDSLGKYLPEYTTYKNITLRQLLHHTSGIPPTDNLRLFAGLSQEMPWDTEDESSMLLKYNKLNFKTNEEHNYSNAGYFLLARVIEKVSGKTFSDCMKEKVFYPLGMKNATIYDSQGMIIVNRASGYRQKGDSFAEANTSGESIFGSTNLYASIVDMINWSSNLTMRTLGSQKLFSRLFIPNDTLNNGDTINYTYGLTVWKHKGLRIADHGGFTMGFKAQSFYVPDKAYAVIVLSNNESTDPWKIGMTITEWILKDYLLPDKVTEHKEISVNKSLYQDYKGSYLFTDGMLIKFDVINDTLKLLIPGAPKFSLYPEGEKEFFLKDFDAQCTFIRGADSKINEIIWHQNGKNLQGIRYSEPEPLTKDEINEYSGRYEINALNTIYKVSVADDGLFINLPKTFRMVNIDTNLKLLHTSGDRFYSSLGMIEFKRNKNGKVNGFVIVDVGRLKNIEFARK